MEVLNFCSATANRGTYAGEEAKHALSFSHEGIDSSSIRDSSCIQSTSQQSGQLWLGRLHAPSVSQVSLVILKCIRSWVNYTSKHHRSCDHDSIQPSSVLPYKGRVMQADS